MDSSTASESWSLANSDGMVSAYTPTSISPSVTAEATVDNTPAYELPFAGGPGTFLFTYLGVLLAAVAAGLVLLRRRNAANTTN